MRQSGVASATSIAAAGSMSAAFARKPRVNWRLNASQSFRVGVLRELGEHGGRERDREHAVRQLVEDPRVLQRARTGAAGFVCAANANALRNDTPMRFTMT